MMATGVQFTLTDLTGSTGAVLFEATTELPWTEVAVTLSVSGLGAAVRTKMREMKAVVQLL